MTATQLSLYVLWGLVLVNLMLTVRLLTWARRRSNVVDLAEEWKPELEIGHSAPTFRAKMLDGRRVDEKTFAGRTIAYAFLSPNCTGCKSTFPQLQAFFASAMARGTEVVVVTDTGQKQSTSWLADFEADGVRMVTPVVVAPQNESRFVTTYNGPLLFPYFVLVGPDGVVASRGIIGKDAWLSLTQFWAGSRDMSPAPAGVEARAGVTAH